jgi:hypothetical protein
VGAATPIVLVTGPPASGKTFVAGLVADGLGLPLIAKDAIKETLFETLGAGDVAWSQQLGRATFALVRWALECQLEGRRPVVVDGNFAVDRARAHAEGRRQRRPGRRPRHAGQRRAAGSAARRRLGGRAEAPACRGPTPAAGRRSAPTRAAASGR